jgi:hypothetical protein
VRGGWAAEKHGLIERSARRSVECQLPNLPAKLIVPGRGSKRS